MKLKEYKKNLKEEYQNTFKKNHSKREFHFKLRYAFLTAFGIVLVALLIEHFCVMGYNAEVKRHNQNIINRVGEINLDESSKLSSLHTKKDYDSIILNYNNMTIFESEKTSILSFLFTFQMISCGNDQKYYPVPDAPDSSSKDPNQNDSFQTNVQVEGLDESDVAKCDGNYIYYLYAGNLYIFDILEEKNITSTIDSGEELYIYKNTIVSLGSNQTKIYELRKNKLEVRCTYEYQKYLNSRLMDNKLYLVYGSMVQENNIEYDACYYDTCSMPNYLYDILCLNLDTLESKKTQLLSERDTILYASKNNFYFASRENYYNSVSVISIFSNDLEPIGIVKISGYVLNQFSMDEYDGYFRVVSTNTNKNAEELNAITIFDLSNEELKKVGYLDQGIGKERQTVRSVRFDKNTCYVVTYQTQDPLYEIDCSNPAQPTIISAYESPGYSNYLHTFRIGEKEYVLGLGYTDSRSSTKISVYEKTDGTVQIGKDFILARNSYYSKADYYNENLILNMFENHKALFIFEDGKNLYLGACVASSSYLIFKIDVAASDVVTIYKEMNPAGKLMNSRLFLVKDKIYLIGYKEVLVEDFQ